MSHVATAKDREIDGNLQAFLAQLPTLMAEHRGEYALLRGREIVGFYGAALDAQVAGNQRYPDQVFSIQHIEEAREDLGFYSYAIYPR